MFLVQDQIRYYSARYNKWVHVEPHFPSDGATGAIDITGPVEVFDTKKKELVMVSLGFLVHDKLCKTGYFADGTKCSNFQASTILSDILRSEKRWVRAVTWWVATFIFGGGKCRERLQSAA